MGSIIGFTIVDTKTGDELATLPLTLPIGATVEGFERAGYSVTWKWCDVGDSTPREVRA